MIRSKKSSDIDVEEAGLLKTINHEFGDGTLIQFNEEQINNLENFWQTGIYSIDYLFGGGIPKGKMIELYGNEGSGKTTLALQLIKKLCDNYSDFNAVYIDAESSFNWSYCQALNIDLSRLFYCQKQVAEEVLSIIKSISELGKVSLIVVDSVAGLIPEAEVENIGDFTVASLARILSSNLRKIAKVIDERNVTVCFINQLRSTVNTSMFAPNNGDITCGGKSLKYYSSVRLELNNSSKLKDANGIIYGVNVNIKATKNKFFPPFRSRAMELIYGKGFDINSDLLNYYIEQNIIVRNGAWYGFENANVAKGKESMLQLLCNEEFMSRLRKYETR